MTTEKSSFLLYDGYQEWLLSIHGLVFGMSYYSQYVKISVRWDEHRMFWYIRCRSGMDKDREPAYLLSIHTTTPRAFRGSVGVKCTLKLVDRTNDAALLGHFKSYTQLRFTPEGVTTNGSWLIGPKNVSPYVGGTKIIVTYQLCNTVTKPPMTLQHVVQLAQALDKDRKEGISTDTIVKHGQAEYKVHKLILAIQSDFFKARFSEYMDINNKRIIVEVNDSDLNPEILEALISGAYTGQVKSFEMAVKLLPVTDKYQFTTLKEVCEHEIAYHITMDNVLDLHQLASYCNAHILHKQCEFIKQ